MSKTLQEVDLNLGHMTCSWPQLKPHDCVANWIVGWPKHDSGS